MPSCFQGSVAVPRRLGGYVFPRDVARARRLGLTSLALAEATGPFEGWPTRCPSSPTAPSVELEELVGSPPGEPDAHGWPVRRGRQQEGAACARPPHGDRHLG